jgi:hypothetical protein
MGTKTDLDCRHYPPPYNYVEYFSRSINISLIFNDAAGQTGFYLPASSSPLHATINSISN